MMTDMVFAPAFAEVDQEREVVLEEIAMYDDTPQELVHDLFSDAVFGSHALGRPVIGTAEVISTISKRAIAGYHRLDVHRRQHRRLGRGQHHARQAHLAAAALRGAQASADAHEAAGAAPALQRRPRPTRFQRRGHRAVSPLPRRAPGFSPVRTGDGFAASRARQHPRRLRRSLCFFRSRARNAAWRTPSTALRRSTPTRGSSASTSRDREENLDALRRRSAPSRSA